MTDPMQIKSGGQEDAMQETMCNDNHALARHEPRPVLYGVNLVADFNLEIAFKIYKLQLDAVWFEEEPMLLNAYRQCISKHKLMDTIVPIRIVDIGCGTGEMITRLIGENGLFQKMVDCTSHPFEIVAVELDRSIYEFCKERFEHLKQKTKIPLSIYNACATKLPFESNTFDIVMNRHMLHCVPKDRISDLLSETYRILKPGGIAHFVAEDMEMIHSSIDDVNKFKEEKQLWSDGICGTGDKVGVDLRIGRKLPAILPAHGFSVQSIKLGLIDTHHVDRQLLVDIFEIWRKLYAEIWIRNHVTYTYDKYFKNFIETTKDKEHYICWSLPMIQAMKIVTAEFSTTEQ